ncbi:Lipopolysaccharide export system protein LptA precursor [Marinomonas aquimarina]|uniref:Lipopolysaccharide export system protein LptA n=1 Tax=Marinomonas aquimarina TaxID=295068 RepID=A0A1A8T4Z2_9GAMM|nr:lipopolysaccharide transport periplasmic protein LptA [Marinomonas aquimarina]SBS27363.1 Lipopolysaccharide export system protein LptA precursor [Marinomonas aquimarina]
MTFQNPKLTFAALAIALICGPSFALPNDHQQPISIEADKAFFDQKQGTASYSGNVMVKQGSIVIEAQQLTIQTNPETGEFKALNAQGSPSKFSQQMDQAGNTMHANGDSLDYDVTTGQLEIHNNGYLQRGEDEISADYIHYLLEEGTFKAENRGSGRVNMTLQPSLTDQID